MDYQARYSEVVHVLTDPHTIFISSTVPGSALRGSRKSVYFREVAIVRIHNRIQNKSRGQELGLQKTRDSAGDPRIQVLINLVHPR
jgi:hypothetical protein